MQREDLIDLARGARGAARRMARTTAAQRAQVLQRLAQELESACADIVAANGGDISAAREAGLAGPMLERLMLDEKRVMVLAQAVRDIAAFPDPVGRVTHAYERPNGLRVEKVRVPLGVILMIYESRPNVTIDAAALCLRSGNAAILRGGSEAQHTNRALAQVVTRALGACELPEHAVQLVPTQDRAAVGVLLEQRELIDLVIPRGGTGLIRRVTEQSRIPVIQHYQGICHVYVHGAADLEMAERVAVNAKVQRPSVCNAMETLLVDEAVAAAFLPRVVAALQAKGVEVRGCAETRRHVDVEVATDEDFATEFLELILAVKVVRGVEGAVAHIDRFGSNHTASVVTADEAAAAQFVRDVDASCVLVNASTRFNDGGELGLGAEMGISTTKLHAYGPMGAEALTSEKFVVHGQGQVRG